MPNTTNVFSKGLQSDLHPVATDNQTYTDALNATFVTYNGNEAMMQNDMGNTKIQDSKTGNVMGLREGFVPVGLKEHGGVMYIASVNKDGEGEIGTIPSPVIRFNQKGDPEIKQIEDIDMSGISESSLYQITDSTVSAGEKFAIGMDLKDEQISVPYIDVSDTATEIIDTYPQVTLVVAKESSTEEIVYHNNGIEYVDLGLPSKVVWAKTNILDESGKSEPYMFAETTRKQHFTGFDVNNYPYTTLDEHGNLRISKYNEEDGLTKLQKADDIAFLKYGGSWRIPTKADFDELMDECTWMLTTQDGRLGYLLTGTNGNHIFLLRDGHSEEQEDLGLNAYLSYWTSETNDSDDAWQLQEENNAPKLGHYYKWTGMHIRPVCDPTNAIKKTGNTKGLFRINLYSKTKSQIYDLSSLTESNYKFILKSNYVSDDINRNWFCDTPDDKTYIRASNKNLFDIDRMLSEDLSISTSGTSLKSFMRYPNIPSGYLAISVEREDLPEITLSYDYIYKEPTSLPICVLTKEHSYIIEFPEFWYTTKSAIHVDTIAARVKNNTTNQYVNISTLLHGTVQSKLKLDFSVGEEMTRYKDKEYYKLIPNTTYIDSDKEELKQVPVKWRSNQYGINFINIPDQNYYKDNVLFYIDDVKDLNQWYTLEVDCYNDEFGLEIIKSYSLVFNLYLSYILQNPSIKLVPETNYFLSEGDSAFDLYYDINDEMARISKTLGISATYDKESASSTLNSIKGYTYLYKDNPEIETSDYNGYELSSLRRIIADFMCGPQSPLGITIRNYRDSSAFQRDGSILWGLYSLNQKQDSSGKDIYEIELAITNEDEGKVLKLSINELECEAQIPTDGGREILELRFVLPEKNLISFYKDLSITFDADLPDTVLSINYLRFGDTIVINDGALREDSILDTTFKLQQYHGPGSNSVYNNHFDEEAMLYPSIGAYIKNITINNQGSYKITPQFNLTTENGTRGGILKNAAMTRIVPCNIQCDTNYLLNSLQESLMSNYVAGKIYTDYTNYSLKISDKLPIYQIASGTDGLSIPIPAGLYFLNVNMLEQTTDDRWLCFVFRTEDDKYSEVWIGKDTEDDKNRSSRILQFKDPVTLTDIGYLDSAANSSPKKVRKAASRAPSVSPKDLKNTVEWLTSKTGREYMWATEVPTITMGDNPTITPDTTTTGGGGGGGHVDDASTVTPDDYSGISSFHKFDNGIYFTSMGLYPIDTTIESPVSDNLLMVDSNELELDNFTKDAEFQYATPLLVYTYEEKDQCYNRLYELLYGPAHGYQVLYKTWRTTTDGESDATLVLPDDKPFTITYRN